jgi:DNA polymerase III delta subunit
MGKLVLAFGTKENATEDIQFLSRSWVENPRILMLSGPSAKQMIAEKASGLFLEEGLVVVLIDPARDLIDQAAPSLAVLKELAIVIVYVTSSEFDLPPSLSAERINLEKEKEERVKTRVLAAVRADGKKMTDKAYALLKERIRDEALLEQELAKIISFAGEKTVIEVKDVSAVVTETHEEDFISLSDAMARKDRKQIMLIVDTLLGQGMNLLAIHGFLTRQISLLLQAKDAADFFKSAPDFRSFAKGYSKLKEGLDGTPSDKRNYLPFQKPYYAYNLCKTGQKFTDETLISFLGMLARFDRAFKRGTKHDRANFEAAFLEV